MDLSEELDEIFTSGTNKQDWTASEEARHRWALGWLLTIRRHNPIQESPTGIYPTCPLGEDIKRIWEELRVEMLYWWKIRKEVNLEAEHERLLSRIPPQSAH